MSKTWDELKRGGSKHYKTNGAEPIDLFRAVVPHPYLTVMEVKALSDAIKYAFRMLQTGTNRKDCDKIIHYIRLAKVCLEERQDKPQCTAADLYAGKGHEELVIGVCDIG